MTEFAWVIEHVDSPVHSPLYFNGINQWSKDHLEAVRFSREQDAMKIMSNLGQGNHRVCEHGWG